MLIKYSLSVKHLHGRHTLLEVPCNNRFETVAKVAGKWYQIIIANVFPNGTGGNAIKLFANENGIIEKLSSEVLIAEYDGFYRTESPCT